MNTNTIPSGADALRDKLTDIIADHLSGTYHCNRVWEAWSYGTMSQDDFEDVGESDTPAELADAIMAALSAAQEDPAKSHLADVTWSADNATGQSINDILTAALQEVRKKHGLAAHTIMVKWTGTLCRPAIAITHIEVEGSVNDALAQKQGESDAQRNPD